MGLDHSKGWRVASRDSMDSFRKGDFVFPANATDSIWRVLKVRQVGGVANFKCLRVTNPRKGDVENFPVHELTLIGEDLIAYRATRAFMAITGILLGLLCCGLAWNDPADRILFGFNAVFWTLGPPLWLIGEYVFLFPKHGNPRNIENFRHSQGLASRFWLGVVALLIVIYGQKVMKQPATSPAGNRVKIPYDIVPSQPARLFP
jgi:hypothetical protein